MSVAEPAGGVALGKATCVLSNVLGDASQWGGQWSAGRGDFDRRDYARPRFTVDYRPAS